MSATIVYVGLEIKFLETDCLTTFGLGRRHIFSFVFRQTNNDQDGALHTL